MIPRRGSSLACLAVVAALLLASWLPAIAAAPRPSLVVVIVVDMLPAGTLERLQGLLTGGFGRLLSGGRRFTQCRHDHAATETGPGHAALASGLHPSHNGIVLNEWYDRAAQRTIYCVGDESPAARPNFEDPNSEPVSTLHMRGEFLADLVKRADPASKVYSVSRKDRSAILMGGHHPDGAFWYSAETGGFTSNPAVTPRLPSWGSEFWNQRLVDARIYRENVPPQWSYPVRPQAGPDDYPYESASFSRVAPHPLAPLETAGASAADRARAAARLVSRSPWIDRLTLELAARIIDEERLGRDASPDLLFVGLSGADAVGHLYGPGSQEYLDLILRVDAWLGDFMQRAERSASGPVVFALSSDHGTLPLPETVPGARRVDFDGLRRGLEAELAARLGKDEEGTFVESEMSGNLYLDRRKLARLKVPLDRAIDETRRALSDSWQVARVFRASDMAGADNGAGGGDAFLDLHRNAYDPDRSGDLAVMGCEGCLFTSQATGTSHGSPYDYDRRVPVILLGPGIPAGEDDRACSTVDLAPTLAALLGLSFESPRDGGPLPLAAQVDRAAPAK